MDFLIGVWFLGAISIWLFGLIYGLAEDFHKRRPLKRFYDSWGGYRFFTIAIPLYTLLVPSWPLVVLYFYVAGIVKGK